MAKFRLVQPPQTAVALFLLELDEVDSTNLEARRRRMEMQGQGVWLVEARRQTAGYGRKGQPWHSQSEKNYYGTFALPYETVVPPGVWSLWVADGVVQALKAHVPRNKHVFVKWPNDICVLEGGEVFKVGGILSEVNAKFLFCGIGLNLEDAPAIRADFQAGVLPAGALGISRAIALPLLRHAVVEMGQAYFGNKVTRLAAEQIPAIATECHELPLQWYYHETPEAAPRSVEILDIAPDTGALHLKFEDGRDAIRLHGSLSAQKLA